MVKFTSTKEVEKIVAETTAKLQNRYDTTSIVILIQNDSAGEKLPNDVSVFHNCDAATAKVILADAWAKLDGRR